MQLLGWSCRSNGCIQVIIPNGELRSYELNFPITGAMNWICTELLICRKRCLWCANWQALRQRVETPPWSNPPIPGEIQVILHGKLLGMPVAVKLPLANASLSLPDLANEFLDRWDLRGWNILKNPPIIDDKWRFIAGKHIYKWI